MEKEKEQVPSHGSFASLYNAQPNCSKKRTDNSDIQIRIPLHILASLPLAKKMTTNANTSRAGQGNYGKEQIMHLLRILVERVTTPIGSEEWTQCIEEHRVLSTPVAASKTL